jgi:hypothetical protein
LVRVSSDQSLKSFADRIPFAGYTAKVVSHE